MTKDEIVMAQYVAADCHKSDRKIIGNVMDALLRERKLLLEALRETRQRILDDQNDGDVFLCRHGTHLYLAGGCSECSPPDLPNRSTKPPPLPESVAAIDAAIAEAEKPAAQKKEG